MHLVLKYILQGVKGKKSYLLSNVVFLSNHQTIIFTRDIDKFECVFQSNTLINIGKCDNIAFYV